MLDEDDRTDEFVRGSKPGRVVINRNRKARATMLLSEYFSSDTTYPGHVLQRRFCVSRKILLDICSRIENDN